MRSSPSPHRTKLLIRNANRNFIVDAQDVIYATIDNGMITLVAANVEGHSNYRTIEDLQANLDKDTFWRVHRSFLRIFTRSRKWCPGSSRVTNSAWTTGSTRKFRSAGCRPSACANY